MHSSGSGSILIGVGGVGRRHRVGARAGTVLLAVLALVPSLPCHAAPPPCSDCHGAEPGAAIAPAALLAASVHADLACTDCHPDRAVVPHTRGHYGTAASRACRACHASEAAAYSKHGWLPAPDGADVPTCADCHGTHGIFPASDPRSRTSPANLDITCGHCHADVDVVRSYGINGNAVSQYRRSAHGKTSRWAAPGASCIDCHALPGSPHVILTAASPRSPIFFFNIATTCGRCHEAEGTSWSEGAHGHRVAHGDTDAPVCTDCHGEHAIVPPGSPGSPLSARHVAAETCAPCHRSVVAAGASVAERGVVRSFFASYHGMRSMTGDAGAATCVSCHQAHRVLPPTDPRSAVSPANVRQTCARCHPHIPARLAAMPIHDLGGREGFRTATARAVEKAYRITATVVISLLGLLLVAELLRMLAARVSGGPAARHSWNPMHLRRALLISSFAVLAATGFALVDRDAAWVHWLFGWPGGLVLRRVLHRGAALVLTAAALWHLVWASCSRQGRQFLRRMVPRLDDLGSFVTLGERPPATPSLIDKLAYWIAVPATAVMLGSGLMLWFDRRVADVLSMDAVDIAWVVHLWQAWLALAAAATWVLARLLGRLRRAGGESNGADL